MSRLWLTIASASVFFLAWMQISALEPRHETGILQIDPPTPYIHYLPVGVPRGRVLTVHGLDVSKETMQLISAALVDGGFEVYSIDLPGHGDSPVGFNAVLSQQAVLNTMAAIGEDNIALGHSFGAGLLLDLSADHHFSTVVLLSPAPTPVARIQADRALIVSGSLDLPRIRATLPILADIGGTQIESWVLPWGDHSAPIFNPVHARSIVGWLGGDSEKTRNAERLFWIVLMLAAGACLGARLMPGRDVKTQDFHIPTILVRYVAACGAALLVLKVVVPLGWLRLFATDYVVSFLLIAGLALWIQQQRAVQFNSAAVLKAVAAASFVIVVFGLIAGSNVLHMTLSNGRWWRFPFIAAAGLPLLTFDEVIIRRIHPRWKSAAIAVTTRALLWAFVVSGVLFLNRESAFLVIVAHLLTLFWIGLWFAAGIVHRHTQSPMAAALFAALVQGWAFSALFVKI